MIKKGMIISLMAIFLSSACDKMEDNYSNYLEKERVYSPKVTHLRANAGLREATLHWDNPVGDIAKTIFISYGDDSLLFETMVDSAVLTSLEIKGYTVSVFTLDAFNNRSVPETLSIFPNGEN